MKKMAPNHRLPWSLPVDRDAFLTAECIDRRVLHLACASAPFTKELHASGQLLHDKLGRCAKDLYGVDVQQDSLDYLRNHGHRQLLSADLLNANDISRVKQDLAWEPEIVLAGELLEHLDRQGEALRNIASLMSANTRLVLTVPNAFSAKAFLRVCCGHEKVSPDHVSYFSLMNLRQLAVRTGLEIESARWYTSSFPTHPIERFVDWILWPALLVRPQLADGIIVKCRLAEVTGNSQIMPNEAMALPATSPLGASVQ